MGLLGADMGAKYGVLCVACDMACDMLIWQMRGSNGGRGGFDFPSCTGGWGPISGVLHVVGRGAAWGFEHLGAPSYISMFISSEPIIEWIGHHLELSIRATYIAYSS